MISIIASVISIAACWRWGAWKRWREFYPTILYWIVGNFAYSYVFCDYTLWEYNSFLAHEFIGLINKFLIYPPAVILYLPHFPERKWKQAAYVTGWAAVGTLIEAVADLMGGIRYEHGWNLYWSALLFLGTFILLRLHYKKPLVVWPISLLCGIAVALIFGLRLKYNLGKIMNSQTFLDTMTKLFDKELHIKIF